MNTLASWFPILSGGSFLGILLILILIAGVLYALEHPDSAKKVEGQATNIAHSAVDGVKQSGIMDRLKAALAAVFHRKS